jgi:hypothetical protein
MFGQKLLYDFILVAVTSKNLFFSLFVVLNFLIGMFASGAAHASCPHGGAAARSKTIDLKTVCYFFSGNC